MTIESVLMISKNILSSMIPLIKNGLILAVNKADILGRFAMPISRYYMHGINSAF